MANWICVDVVGCAIVLAVLLFTLACSLCQRRRGSFAAQSDRPDIATETLLMKVLVTKFYDHLPLYRQAGTFVRQGIELDRSTLCDWIGRACWWLEPLWCLLLAHGR